MTKSPRHERHDAGVGYRRRSRLGRQFLVLTLLLLVVLFSAPIVISRTNLRHKVVPLLLPELAGSANIGQAQLSWFSPARLEDISILDADGKLLFEAESVSSSRTLGQMALGYTELGMFQINKPHLHLVLHESGTNFDAFLASLEEDENAVDDDDDSNSNNVAFGVEIIDGTIDIRDVATGETCQLSEVSLRLQSPKPTAGPLAVQLAAKAIHQEKRGTLAADFVWNQPTQLSPHDLGNGELKVETQGLPMAALLPIYRRGDLDLSTQGELTGNVNCQWNQGANGPELLADGALTVAGAVVRMPSIFGQDMLQSPVLSVSLNGAIQNEELRINKLDTESDYGQLRMRGHIPLAELFASDLAETLATWKSRHRLHTEGQLDLRKLAESLPQTMRLRDDTALVGGTVTLALDSEPTGAEARKIHGGVTTADIVATTGGKTVSWTQPMEIQFAVDSRPAGVAVERFNCSSGFFQASAAGTLAAGSFEASGDFDRLATQLAQFCDLGDSQLAGRFHGDGSWSTAADQSYEARAEFTVEDFHLTYDKLPPWQEKQLVVAAKALGKADGATISRIDAMEATIESEQDFFSAKLTAPVSEISTKTAWPIDCKLRGQVSTWLTRLRPWVSTGQWQISGGIAATASGTVSPQVAFLQPCTVELSDLKAASSSNLIAEPTVKANGTLEWDGRERRVSLPTLEIVSSALALRARDVNVTTAENRIDASGDAAFRGDLARLSSWLQKPTEPATQNLRGNLEGR